MPITVYLLSACQALLMIGNSIIISTSALVGAMIAPSPSLATVPVALQFLAVTITTLPASLLMQRIGRRAGFALGASLGLVGALLAVWSILEQNFRLFCFSGLLFGCYLAFASYYRFAAAEAAPPERRARAISVTMLGGLVAGFVGPSLANLSSDMFTGAMFAGSFVCVAIAVALTLLIIASMQIPPAPVQPGAATRSLWKIARQTTYVVAALGAIIGYGSMNLIMTATPLAMGAKAYPFASTALVIQWHVVAMFAPSFFTGRLIERFSAERIMSVGALLLLACVAVNFSGQGVAFFWTALVLLGVGWNFLFIGGTTLLTRTYDPAERAKAQGFNDLMMFGTLTITALGAGWLHASVGWLTLNAIVVAPALIALAVTLWLKATSREEAPAS